MMRSPGHIVGVYPFHGKNISVVDLGRLLGFGRTADGVPLGRSLIVIENTEIGFLVDAVLGVETLHSIPMPKEVHFHMLRKTRAMDLYQAGCPLSYIQQLLGHENISTTRGFYAFATLKTLADAIEKTNPSGSEEKLWKKESVLKQLYRL